ncbi:MAG: type II toxin-antitoxin system RelE/ParE family toxin [Myxococcales bacterium]
MTADRPIHLSPGAESDIDHAIAWYNLRREDLGFEFWIEVRGMFESIRMNPEVGALWRPPEPFRKRVLSRFPFVVFYTVRPEAIVVEAVAHGARRPGYWLSRTKP